MIIREAYTGGSHYQIRYKNGRHYLYEEYLRDEYKVVFNGSMDQCVEKLNSIIEENAEYDLGI